MKLSSRLLIVFVLAAVLLSACTVGGRNALVGKWTPEQTVEGQPAVIWEYTAGGRFRSDTAGVVSELTYQFEDDKTIIILVPQDQGGSSYMNFVVAGDKLTLTFIDPQTRLPAVDTQTNQPVKPIAFVRVK